MNRVRLRYIKEEISRLPIGNVTYKKINGKRYPYYQWSENGKQKSRIVKEDELKDLIEKIHQKKELEKILREEQSYISESYENDEEFYFSFVKKGKDLYDFIKPVKEYKKRECYLELYNYIFNEESDKVLILYGLRRTGKTTLIRQAISEMNEEMLDKTVFMQMTSNMDLSKLNLDMKQLSKKGYKYIFIDEVTLMDDFIENAAIFSDIFAAGGMKIVLSGTDSLGFIISKNGELYDRASLIHTTFISYREFETVSGKKGIDEYIRYGGTMSLQGMNYNESKLIFSNKKSTDEYVDIAIAHNIQHSLKNYQNGNHFRNLYELYENNELTSAINRIVEDINHRFTIEVLTKDFKSNDLSLSAKNMLKDRERPNSVLYQIDIVEVTNQVKNLLDIRNKNEQKVKIKESHQKEIKEYLDLLDVTKDIDIVYLSDFNTVSKHTVISQPGLRYAQAEALIKSLFKDDVFRILSITQRNEIIQRILSDIKGRMMEEIVLLETKIAKPDCEVFKLIFATGEFDMVIFEPDKLTCSIFEIKHSSEIVKNQYRHLTDEVKCKDTEFHFGTITNKTVIYSGKTQKVNDINYVNVEEYLKKLGK